MINWTIILMTVLGIVAGLCLTATFLVLFFMYELRKSSQDDEDLLVIHSGEYNEDDD